MSYLIDTNVVSEKSRARANNNVLAWFQTVQAANLYMSVLVIGELRRGIEGIIRRDPQQAAALERWLNELRAEFTDRILPVTEPVAERWGRLYTNRTLPTIDGLIAATALVHDFTIVTRNVRDFAGTGVRLLNPFEPAP